MKRALLKGLLALSLAATAVVAVHAVRRQGGGMPAEPPLFRVLRLAGPQKREILSRRERLMALREATSTRLAELRGELAEGLAQGEDGRARIDEVLGRMEEAQREYQRGVVEHLLGVRATLTPEQRPVFAKLLGARLRAGWMMQSDGIAPVTPGGGGR